MQSRLVGCGIGLALLLIACGSQASHNASSKVTCSDAIAPHHAYVVVQHLSGAWIERCVSFTSDSIDGQTVMDRSGIEYKAQVVTAGKVVCQVDEEPAHFSQCFPLNQPYWALFVETGGHWASAPSGYTDIRLHDSEAIGWHYVQAADPAPAPPPKPNPA